MPASIRSRIFRLPGGYKNIKIKIYGNIILPVLLCGCETWYLTLKEKHRLKKNQVNEGLEELAC
jgi:hypothetical protein